MIKTALIFAAGRGERLMPFTQYTPKPMLKVGQQPLLEFHIKKLSQTGIENIIINHAHMGAKIRQYFGNGHSFGTHISYLPEPPGALETGGTLAFIQAYLSEKDKILFCINGDVYTDYQANCHFELAADIHGHLILIPVNEELSKGNFGLDCQNQRILPKPPTYIFSGISYYQTAALKQLFPGRYSIRNWLFEQAKLQNLTGEIYPGVWCDIGTPSAWEAINQRLLVRC